MLVMTLPSRAGDGAAESVFSISHQGATADRLGAAVNHACVVGTCQGTTADCQSTAINHRGVTTDHQGPVIDSQGAITDRHGVADLAAPKPKRLSLRDVLIAEAIHLDVWIFTPTPRWAPTVVVYDNNFLGGGHKIKRMMVTHKT
jgi:hypothetical protein